MAVAVPLANGRTELFVDDEPRLGQRLVKDVTAAAQAAINAKGSFSSSEEKR